jgi:hypothetical protein
MIAAQAHLSAGSPSGLRSERRRIAKTSPARLGRYLYRPERNGTLCYISVTCQAVFNAELGNFIRIIIMIIAVWFCLS